MNFSCSSCATVYRIDPDKVPEAGVRARCTVCSNVISVSRDEEVESENRPPRQSREQMARAVLGDAFIAPSVPEPTSAPPEPLAVQSPPPAPTPPLEPAAHPSLVATAPMPAVQPPAEKGRLRVARPFSPPGPGQRPTRAPREQQRPTAPVFRPTPGMPLKPAAPLPAEPKPPVPAQPVAEVPPTPITPQEPAPAPAVPPATPVAQARAAAPPLASPSAPAAAAPPATPPAAKPVINPFMSKDPKQKARRLARALISDMIVYQPEKRQEAIEDGKLKEVFGEEVKKSWEEYVAQVGEEIANSTPFFTEALNDILAGGQSVF